MIYNKFSDFYEATGKLDSALYFTKKASAFNEEQILNRHRVNIQKLEAEQEKMRRQFTVERVSADLKNSKAKLHLLIGFLAVTILILSLIGFLSYKLYKKNSKILEQNNTIEKSNNELQKSLSGKNILLKELNHRVKNNLSLILSLTRIHEQNIKDEKAFLKFQDLENRIRAIAITHEQFVYSDNLELDSKILLHDYLDKIINALLQLSPKPIKYSLDVDDISISMDTILPIGIMINELMSNTIKHAKSKNKFILIKIHAQLKNKKLFMSYSDSGERFGFTGIKDSLGLFIIESMVQQLAGTFERNNSDYHFVLNLK